MNTIDWHDFQQDPAGLLSRVAAGESFVVVREQRAVAKIRPCLADDELRPFGLCAGQFKAPDDFDAALPDDALRAFEGR